MLDTCLNPVRSRTALTQWIVLALLVVVPLPSAVLVTSGAPATFQTLGHVEPVSSIPFTLAWSLSHDGLAVTGDSHPGFDPIQAFRWTQADGMTGVGEFFGFKSHGREISNRGEVVVGVVSAVGAGIGAAFRWTAETGIVTLGEWPDSYASQADGVSADGSVIVGGEVLLTGDEVAWVWTEESGKVALNDLAGVDNLTRAMDVSADGSVITGFSSNGPFVWSAAEGVTYFDPGTSLFETFVHSISSDGTAVVGATQFSTGTGAFRWTAADGMLSLGKLLEDPPPTSDETAYAVSGDGSVVVGESGDRAFIWDEENGMRDLRVVLIDEYGLDLEDWFLARATGISADGLTISGYGSNDPLDGLQSWIVRLPEPSTLSLLMLAAMTLRRRNN